MDKVYKVEASFAITNLGGRTAIIKGTSLQAKLKKIKDPDCNVLEVTAHELKSTEVYHGVPRRLLFDLFIPRNCSASDLHYSMFVTVTYADEVDPKTIIPQEPLFSSLDVDIEH